MVANAFGAPWAKVEISRDTVGSEATAPNTPGSPRSTARSETQSPPTASVTARSSTILPGSWTAPGLRHGIKASDNSLVRPRSSPRSAAAHPTRPATRHPPRRPRFQRRIPPHRLTHRKSAPQPRSSILNKSNYRRSEHPFANSVTSCRNWHEQGRLVSSVHTKGTESAGGEVPRPKLRSHKSFKHLASAKPRLRSSDLLQL